MATSTQDNSTQELSPISNGNAVSPRVFASQHARPQTAYKGCSRILDYEMMGKLGEGTFGEVHRARSKKTGSIYALKKILMHNEKDGFPITALREIKLLKLLSHKNVLKLEEMSVEHQPKVGDKKKRSVMYMVTPYMDHDLSGLLENPGIHITVPQIKCYMLQLLEGVRYLHDQKILHRDMKAANLLINNKGILQIADFGLARHYDDDVPVAGRGPGEAKRDYTTLVVTRWYRPPELLMQLRRYTTAIDLWGVGCVFGEMIYGKPILAGESDNQQLHLIFELMGAPTAESMPGWQQLPGAEGRQFPPKPPTLAARFHKAGPQAISLLSELLKLDWKSRINAVDALKHPYFDTSPYPAKPGDLPTFEESHELDRRKFRSQQAAPPPAPKGGTVGMGQAANYGHDQATNSNFNGYRHQPNGTRPPHPSDAKHHNGHSIPPPPPQEDRRQPAWRRDDHRRDDPRPDTRLPPRPPVDAYNGSGDRERYRRSHSRDIDHPPRNRNGPSTVDTYIPSYDGARSHPRPRDREDRSRDGPPRDRRRGNDRRHDRDRLEYDDRSRNGRTRSRSRSRGRSHDRERYRERDGPLLKRDLEKERERDQLYRR